MALLNNTSIEDYFKDYNPVNKESETYPAQISEDVSMSEDPSINAYFDDYKPVERVEPGWVETITEAVTEDVPAGFKVSGGGLMQYAATPGGLASKYPGPMQAPSLLLDIAKQKWGKPIVEAGKELSAIGRKDQQEGIRPYTPGSPKYYTRKIVSGAAEMLPSIAAGIVTRNPSLSLAMMGTHAGASKYDQSIREGRSHDQATTDGIFFGLSEALTEKIPLGILVKRGGGYFVNIGKAGAAEAIQEPVNEFIQQLYDTAVLDKEMTLDEVIHNMGEAAKIGGGVGVLLSAITGLFIRRGGSLVDLDDTTLDTKPGELDLDETRPIVGPPGPTTTVMGPPAPPPFVGPPGPTTTVTGPPTPPLVGPPAPIDEAAAVDAARVEPVPVDVPTISTGAETRQRATEKPIIDAEETVDRETVVPEYKDRVAGDPLSEPGAWQNLKNTINNVVSSITVGGENAKKGYNKFVQEHLKYFNENPDQAASQPEARANSYLETDESGNERSIYVAEDGTRVELAERLGNMPEPQRENETREEYVTRLKEEAELEPAWSDTLTLFGSFLAADTTGVIKDKFEEFMYQIARYNKNFRDDPRKALKVVIDLGGSGAGNTLNSHANYVGSTNTINVSFNSLMNAEQNWTETAIHELTHQKFWSFFFSQVAKSYPEVNEREAHSLVIRHINEFGFKMFTPFRKEILSFVKKSWAEGGSEAVANRLNISPKLLSSAKNPQEAFDILRNATSIDRSQDFALDLSFSLVHELLAYEGMTIEMLKQEGIVPTAAQRSFIQKFLRYVKQTLQEMLGVKTLSKQDIQEFIIVMFLEPQNAMEVDSSVNTQVMQYYKVDQIRPTLEKIQRAKRGEEPISRMAAEDQPDDPSRRRFMKQTAGAVAGAIVDPTILAEPATAAAATVAKGIIPQAISTAYRFAVSVPVQTAEGEMIEGESIIDVDYDSESNTLSVQDLDQDGNIITEEKFEVPIKDPTMKDIDDFAASVIKTGVNPLDPKGSQIFDPKAVYSVQSPIRDPHWEEGAAGEFGEGMTEEELKDYDASDLDFLKNVGEGVNSTDPVHPTGSQVDHSVRSYEEPPRVTLDGEPIGPTGKLMKRQPYDSLVAHPEDHMARKAGLARPTPKPATEPGKVIDQVTETISQNTEALGEIKETVDVIKEAIKQISGMTLEDVEGKPVEGEVIPAKRKREPGMAEEETMQDLRDALAGSEERLERLQDVGRDEDVETIEEYEAEIEAYKKDIKDLKEEMKEVGATLPRKEGEGPVLRQAATTDTKTLEKEYNELTADINDDYAIPRADGTTITIAEMAEILTGGTDAKQSGWQGWNRRTTKFWKAILKLLYSPLAKEKFKNRFQFTDFFNAWNKNVEQIKDSNWTLGDGTVDIGTVYQAPGDKGVQTTIRRISEKFTNTLTMPVLPWGHSVRESEKGRRRKLNKLQYFKDWLTGKDVPDNPQAKRQFADIKNKLDAWIEKFHPEFEGEVSVKEGRFSREWYKANENTASFQFQVGKSFPTGEFLDFIGIAERLRGSKSPLKVGVDAITRRLRSSKASKNVKQAFNFVLTNAETYEQIDDIFGSIITEEIFNDFKELKTNKEKDIFIDERLGTSIKRINDSGRAWDSLKKHITHKVGIPYDRDHIIDLGVSELLIEEDGILSEKTVDSLGYDHPFSWMLLPSALNRLITPSVLKEWSKKLNKNIEKPTDVEIVNDYFTAYFDHIRNNTKDISLNELIIEASDFAYKEVKNHPDVKTYNIQWKKGRTLPSELTQEEINELDLGTVESELAKEDMARDPQAQRDLIKEFRNALADISNDKGNAGPKADEQSVLREPLLQQAETRDTVEEYKRQAGWHQNAFTSFASFMWSKPVETIRRYRYASPTMAKLADMIQRDISETKRVIKGGLDYIQRKGMALGQFRVALQATLDNMTGRTGVVSKAVNDAVALYLIQGTPIKDPKVAKAAQEMKNILESIYTWSTELGSKTTKGFSLRPLDGGLLPRVWNIEELATTNGRKKFIKLLASIGIVDNLDSENEFEQTAATDAYNIALNSGGFISGDFTTTAYNQKSKKYRKFQVELFEKIEKEVSRAKLGTLLVNDIQAALPRFVDKAIEKTLYAELFGHYDEVLWDMKAQIEKEIREYNQLDSTKRPVKTERAMQDIKDMMDIIRHRYKMQSTWFNTRRYVQWFTNFTTVTLMPFVSLASMPEFFTPLMLGSKNPIGFVNDFRSVSWYSALRAMNGMSKLFRGKQLDAMLYPKGKAARRAMFLKALGIIDIKSQGEAAAMRYIGPSFIRTGIAAQGPGAKLGIKALYKLYGLGDVATGRFRARQVRSLMNMDTYFEIVLLTSLTQMQQQMAANNLRRYTISLLKSISKGKGNTLQDMKILKDFGLTREEINEAVRWYKAGHREFYDVPTEFKWDPSGMTLRFVDQVITRPNEATASKAFRHPGFAPLLIFKSFMTTFGNTFMVAMRDRVRFAEGEGTAKTYQQAKMAAGYLATMGAMYGMVMFAQSIRHMLQYDDDDDDYMEDVPEWKKFVALLNRTGLLTAPGSQLVDIFLPYKYGWWQKGGERAQDVILGPAYGQSEEILNLITDLANNGEVDLEKFLGRIAPITKYEMFRDVVGAPSYYEKD